MDFLDYGYDPASDAQPGEPRREADTLPARVVAVHRGRFALVCPLGQTDAVLKLSRYGAGGPEAFPTVGDFVRIAYQAAGDSLIVRTLPRKSFFSRREPGPIPREQAVAANFDVVCILSSFNQDLQDKRLERYLTLGFQSGATPVVVLNKLDLCPDPAPFVERIRAISQGAPVLALSAKTGEGLSALDAYLRPRKTLVFLGSSGVGKSSLVNALAGEDVMRVREIREADARGRHTTTHRELIRLKSGVLVIDTPGMRELGMWDVSEGLGEAFADVERHLGDCRFRDCRHRGEPGCALRAAVARGELEAARLESYLQLKGEARYDGSRRVYLRRKGEAFLRELEARKLSKATRQKQKRKTSTSQESDAENETRH